MEIKLSEWERFLEDTGLQYYGRTAADIVTDKYLEHDLSILKKFKEWQEEVKNG